MPYLKQPAYLLLGLLLAIVEVGFVCAFPSALGQISLVAMFLTIWFFLRQKETTFALAAGLGIGLGLFSGYDFWVWLVAALVAAGVGYFLSGTVLTDQSLFALVVLNAFIHAALFVGEFVFSNLFAGVGPIKLQLSPGLVMAGVFSLMVETLLLYLFFLVYRRVRGKKATRLMHI